MATVTTQASAAIFRPCASKSRFLSSTSGKFNREVAFRPVGSPASTSFKVKAKKGEWLPGLASPGYLNGSLAGDNGFDPLGLAEDPENLKWFVQAELVNGRWAMLGDIKNPGSVNQDPIFKQYSLPPNDVGYPGGIFNPLNFAPTQEAKEKEIANGRLAMLAFLGFIIQHNVTGKGPFDNLLQHLSDPWHNTIVQTLSGN
ncbi:putative chlorophyll A-B binding protein [Lupinus albus]|uniref:Chlorophyll a-b binding protein, chloroplastic n=1 Tax=Lupinus albus TaxID=3870 RepID=A0A6A4Q3K8_LUPAL|nr:putative chlorophyll A-B binding protein [Lupinus albus]